MNETQEEQSAKDKGTARGYGCLIFSCLFVLGLIIFVYVLTRPDVQIIEGVLRVEADNIQLTKKIYTNPRYTIGHAIVLGGGTLYTIDALVFSNDHQVSLETPGGIFAVARSGKSWYFLANESESHGEVYSGWVLDNEWVLQPIAISEIPRDSKYWAIFLSGPEDHLHLQNAFEVSETMKFSESTYLGRVLRGEAQDKYCP